MSDEYKDSKINKYKHVQTQAEWAEKTGEKILDYLISELYMDFRFMDIALTSLVPLDNEKLISFATDGRYIFYGAEHMIEVFKKNEKFLERAYLHSVLHCVYAHLWLKDDRDTLIWNISCDIAVEYVIDHLDKNSTRRVLSYARQKLYENLKKKNIISAAQIYDELIDNKEYNVKLLYREFFTDDHCFWPDKQPKTPQQKSEQNENKKRWNKIARQMHMQQERSKNKSEEGEQMMLAQAVVQKRKRSYSEFLKKFAKIHEEMHCDLDEFDLTYYTLGLVRYGNIPLIEPIETREVKKIQEFVIVLDTSYSTSGELIKNFLRETAAILLDDSVFFRESVLHIIQCDDDVRSDIVVKDKTKLENVLNKFTIQGGGNTDFRPAFAYVNQLIEEKKLKNPGGLIYFTDGRGIYPKKKPEYKTAFVFLGDYEEDKVPAWAMRIKIER